MPRQAGPAVELELGNPLQLTKTMRARLLAAVLALLGDPSLAGVPDTGRLGAVVLYAKSRAPQGRPDDNLTSIWGAELGRWLGVSESTAHHAALPSLRRSGAVRTRVVRDAEGHPTGLDCLVMPLWRARQVGAGHPLALSKAELAVLLRLCEVLFGPGWAPKDKEPVPAGLLAARTGRGAATDRLGLLLMALSTNRRGWLQLCPGRVDTSRGRPAATVARLLGCSAAAGAKVLSRLEEHGVADVERRKTGSGLNGKSRVRLMPVAEAHGYGVREAHSAVKALFSDLAGTACGDHGAAGDSETGADAGDFGAGGGESAAVADLAGTAELHADHASVVTEDVNGADDGGFSGEAVRRSCRRPERAGTREDQVHQQAATVPRPDGPGSALRAEQTNPPHSPAFSCLGALSRRVPQVAAGLSAIIPSPNSYQQQVLARLVRGLLAEGSTDALIAERLWERLRPLATGDPDRPYAFRRDALSWALSVGLPRARGGMTLVPCAQRGCSNLTRGRATDRVRCDECELAVWQTRKARQALEGALVAPLPQPAAPSAPVPPVSSPAASSSSVKAEDVPVDGRVDQDAVLPGPVREQLLALADIAPDAVPAARTAAHAAYQPAQESESAQAHARRVSAATATWCSITTRFADQLASAHHAGSAA
ncbi:hypothetical protein ACWC5C_38825 [Streptomyces sp. NPDC001700]